MNPIIRGLMLTVAMTFVLSGMVMSTTLCLAATPTLRDLLPEDLKKGLTPAEAVLLDKSQQGYPANFTTGDNKIDDPVNAAIWGPKRTIRARLIYWLCTDKAAARLVHAKGINIGDAKITGPLDFEGADIPHRLGLAGCALETVILVDASTRTLAFKNCVIGGFRADRLRTSGSLLMKNVKVTGLVSLLNADIGGDLVCAGAEFNNSKGYAFCADGLKVKGSVFLSDGFKANGEVRLLDGDIGGMLNCVGAKLENSEGIALNADGLKVNGTVFLRGGLKAVGEFRLLDADIGKDLDCGGSEFDNPKGNAFYADGLKIKGTVFLRNGFKARGEVHLISVDIGGNLECRGGEFDNPNGGELTCENANIKGTLNLSNIKGHLSVLDLALAKAGSLVDDKTGWPDKGKLLIDGFEYGGLLGDATPKSAHERLEWLRLQPAKRFYPRPYEQLAKIFRDMGKESDAKEIQIAKQDDLRKSGELGLIDWCWNGFLGLTIGHGYRTERALAFLIVLWLFGGWVFGRANNKGIMLCSKECGGQTFSPLMYSLDVLLPVINFHQKDYFLPDANTPYGNRVRKYFWFQIFVGWIRTMLLVAFWTGLVRK